MSVRLHQTPVGSMWRLCRCQQALPGLQRPAVRGAVARFGRETKALVP